MVSGEIAAQFALVSQDRDLTVGPIQWQSLSASHLVARLAVPSRGVSEM